MRTHPRIIEVKDYEPYVGAETVERILNKAKPLRDKHIVHINSTQYGGGVAELLVSMTLLMNTLGTKTGWRTIHGYPDFFVTTKKMHNALQGGKIRLTPRKKEIYEGTCYENMLRTHLNHDIVVIHDPQPLPLINYYKKLGPWIWRLHIDLSNPNRELWDYLKGFIEKYDSVIVSIKEYLQKLKVPQHLFMPAIDPFSLKNRELTDQEMDARLKYHNIPTDLPLVVQISRFDIWKDPEGVIKAFKIAQKKVKATLVLLGNAATDDPEGQQVFEALLNMREERILILSSGDDTALVNTLQRKAAVVLQKSIREGFGLTVAEAMWKGTPVIGGNVGGIRYQIKDGENGYLVSSVQEAGERIVTLIKDEKLRERMGMKARQSVQQNFLLTRLLEQYLDLFQGLLTKKVNRSQVRV